MDIEVKFDSLILDGSNDRQGIEGVPVYNRAFSEPLAVATIPTCPLSDGCTHAAITSPCCTTNCWDLGIDK